MLTLTIVGWTLACLHLYPLAVAMSLIGFIEGIIYLTKSDQDFYLDYIVKKKGWF